MIFIGVLKCVCNFCCIFFSFLFLSFCGIKSVVFKVFLELKDSSLVINFNILSWLFFNIIFIIGFKIEYVFIEVIFFKILNITFFLIFKEIWVNIWLSLCNFIVFVIFLSFMIIFFNNVRLFLVWFFNVLV